VSAVEYAGVEGWDDGVGVVKKRILKDWRISC
jgi:hypothetical protein